MSRCLKKIMSNKMVTVREEAQIWAYALLNESKENYATQPVQNQNEPQIHSR